MQFVKDCILLDSHHGSDSGMTWTRKQAQGDGWYTVQPRQDKLQQLAKQQQQMQKEVRNMVASTNKLMQSLPSLKGIKLSGSEPSQTSKAWNCAACNLLHNNPKCTTCRACGKERSLQDSESGQLEEAKVHGATDGPSNADKGSRAKGKGKGKSHNDTMSYLQTLQQSIVKPEQAQLEEAAMEVEQADSSKGKAEDNSAKLKELQAIIDGLEKMPQSDWVKESLVTHKAQLASLKRPSMSANAELAHVLKLESASLNQFEQQSNKLDKKLSQAREQLQQAQKLLDETMQEQKVLSEQRKQAKEQFATTKQALQAKTGQEPVPAATEHKHVSPDQALQLVNSSIGTYAPSQEVKDLGLTQEQMLMFLNNFASTMVMGQVVANAAAATQLPVDARSGEA